MKEPVLLAKEISKTFPGRPPVEVLRELSLKLSSGETLAIMGKSGEGKSTLLHILGTLDTPTHGHIEICGKDLQKYHLPTLRNQKIGFIFQTYNLLEEFTVLENICLPLRIARKMGDIEERALTLLEEVGLLDKASLLTKYLSGGEKQRVTIARALSNDPKLLLADEPTGNLDNFHSQQIQDLLLHAIKKWKKSLILVTHDEDFAKKCDRVLFLKSGHLYTCPV